MPTTAALDKGVYREIEPVAVVPLSNTEGGESNLGLACTADGLLLGRTLLIARRDERTSCASVARSNASSAALLATPRRSSESWSVFARRTLTWSIEETDGLYQIVGYRKNAKNYWERDPNRKIAFPAATTADDVIGRLIAIMQNAAAKKPQ